MASSGKKKTTMGKIMREAKLRERKLAKAARKDARKHSPLGTTEDIPEISDDAEFPADGNEESDADAGVSSATEGPAVAGSPRPTENYSPSA